MTIIKIEQNENGSHDNQTIYGVTPKTFPVPEGWAVILDSMGGPDTMENFPFGKITVAEIEGLPLVTGWKPLPIPEPEPGPETEEIYTNEDMFRALTGT